LRPYQQEAVRAIIKGFGEFRTQLRICPTGGGKTVEFAALAAHYLPGKTLIIAHRDELIEQACDKIQRFAGLAVQIEKASSVRASPRQWWSRRCRRFAGELPFRPITSPWWSSTKFITRFPTDTNAFSRISPKLRFWVSPRRRTEETNGCSRSFLKTSRASTR
jgi:hypothetical protein